MRIVLFSAFLLSACASSSMHSTGATSAAQKAPLYDRLGGRPAITAVVGAFVDKVGSDSRLNARFVNTDIPRLKAVMVDHVCELTGGPCKYKGKDMRTVHTGMQISEAEFAAFAEDLKATLDKLKVPAQEQSEVLAVFGGMKGDVVGH